jgi:glucosamine-6-phosphate deaminase
MYQVFDTVDEVSRYTAQRVFDEVKATPDAVLGFATGSTMVPVYAWLLQRLQQTSVDVSQLTTFNH